MKTTIITLAAAASSLLLSNCASMQNAGVADYNGDGIVSDAEARQYHKQKGIENHNVDTERNKRQNAMGWAESVNRTKNIIKYW